MKVRWNPKQQRFPALTGKLVTQTFRGQIHIQKWPRKRGPSKLAKQRRQVKWFTDANALAKRLWPDQIKLAMIMTKGTGLYPRDLLLRQMSGGIYDIFTGDGVHYRPTSLPREDVMFQGAILQLDANQVLPIQAFTKISWPLPVLDTMGFWDMAQPTRLTIPEGVEVVALSAGWVSVESEALGERIIRLRKNNGGVTRDQRQSSGLENLTTSRGADVCVAGDFYEVDAWSSTAANIFGVPPTFFTIQALQVVL